MKTSPKRKKQKQVCAGKGPKNGYVSSAPADSLSRGATALRSVARLLLAQISVSDLRKAQARSFGHAKRRARIAAGIEENNPPRAVKRSVGLNGKMKAVGNVGSGGGEDPVGGGDGNNGSGGGGHRAKDGGGGGDGSKRRGDLVKELSLEAAGQQGGEAGGEAASASASATASASAAEPGDSSGNLLLPPDNTSTRREGERVVEISSSSPFSTTHFSSSNSSCQECGRVVLGHPLDTISARCGGGGGGLAARETQGGQPIAAAAAGAAAAAMGTGKAIAFEEGKLVAAASFSSAAANAEFAWKRADFAGLPKSAGGTGSSGLGTATPCQRGKRNGGVGASAISKARKLCTSPHMGVGFP